MKDLYLTLKKEWFEKIKSGEKNVEYREAKDYWKIRLEGKSFNNIIFRNGYSKNAPVIKKKFIKTLKMNTGMGTDLNINLPVYAIYFKDIND